MIVHVAPTSVLAVVRGDSGVLREVRWDPRRGWSCSCPSIGPCAHAMAAAAVCLVPGADGRWIDVDALLRSEVSA